MSERIRRLIFKLSYLFLADALILDWPVMIRRLPFKQKRRKVFVHTSPAGRWGIPLGGEVFLDQSLIITIE